MKLTGLARFFLSIKAVAKITTNSHFLPMDKLVEVALKVATNNGIFTYRVPNCQALNLIGKRVRVELKNRELLGVIVGESLEDASFKVKDVLEIIDQEPIITTEQLALMKFCADYYFNDLGACAHMAVMRNVKKPRVKDFSTHKTKSLNLSEQQEQLANEILAKESGAFLLQGVTGSGKTHVYMQVAKTILDQGKSVLFLVPEISLTPQLLKRVEEALGIKALAMHSNITDPNKRDHIFALLRGEARVLIGARSAIFAPLKNLGLIVVDEEHDASLKQDDSPRYHARDLALWRAKNEGARIILGTATPSLESIYNAQQGRLTHLFLNERFQKDRGLPEVILVDLKERSMDVDFRTQDQSQTSGQKMCIMSRPLVLAMKETLANNAQVLLFLNQRGYAKFGVCKFCGHLVECPNCSVGLTYYQKRQSLLCHQCTHTERALITCKNCLKDGVNFLGLGTERLEEEVRALFPDKNIVRLDRDVVHSQKRLESTLNAMHERTADIMIGTQMIAKGHDFLHVTLVGVICADVGLSMPDFRASEKTFQLLTQVAGRAGRGKLLGKAMIQTFNPEHPSIYFAKTHNVKDFIDQELSMRRRFSQPPYCRAALIRIEHEECNTAENIIKKAHEILATDPNLKLLGPAPSSIEKINGRFRFQSMAMALKPSFLHKGLSRLSDKALQALIKKSRARFIIDVDPQSLG
jgi:primosomal protein N' (replication factor Y)